MTHQAAFINSKHARLEIGPIDTPIPGDNELLINVKAIGFNPIESKIQKYEVFPMSYPTILGFSYAGVVESVGSGVKGFKPGDRVATARPTTDSRAVDPRWGAFQQYALAEPSLTSKLLPETTLEDGAATILNLTTVTTGLSYYMGLDRPNPKEIKPSNGKKVLIYGGTSSCGGLAIRYAKAAGYDVVTTTSPPHLDYIKSLGPAAIIDHKQPHEKILADVRANGPYHAVFDTIGLPPVTAILVEYFEGIGGGKYNTLIPAPPGTRDIPENVTREFQSYDFHPGDEEMAEMCKWFNEELLPQGLASGVIVPTPLQWVQGGLAQTQQALDLMDRGEVSGRKLMMDPWE